MMIKRYGSLVWMVALLLVVSIANAGQPERDIAAIESVIPGQDSDRLPGQITGQRIREALSNGLSLIRARVPKVATGSLVELDRKLRRILAGRVDGLGLPASYRRGNELWLPVASQRLRVRLDAPDLRLRPSAQDDGAGLDDLLAVARRTDWLPLRATAGWVEAALSHLVSGETGLKSAQQSMQAAIQGVQSRLRLENRPMIIAYYSVEKALAAAPRWPQGLRGRLRRSAESLHEQTSAADLARRLRAQADQFEPDFRKLQALALDLRRRIEASASQTQGK